MEVHSEQGSRQRWRMRNVLLDMVEHKLLSLRAALIVKSQPEISMHTDQQTQEKTYHERRNVHTHP